MEQIRSSLRTGNELAEFLGLVGSVVFAGLFHIAVPGMLYLIWLVVWGSERHLAQPEDYMEVSMVVLPRSDTQMAHKAMRAPVESGSADAPVQEAPKNPSDMQFKSDKVEEKQGQDSKQDDATERRRKMLLALMSGTDAPEGPVDQVASDPDSTSDEAINATGTASATDPELARYVAKIESLFKANFHPLPTITMANPEIVCAIAVKFDLQTGKVIGYEIKEPSGNASYDGAAERAVQAVTQVPLPPEKHKARFQSGYLIRYTGEN